MIIKEKKIEVNVIKNEISKWLKDLKKIFETILERKLLLNYEKVNYEIILKIKEIKSSSLIPIKLKK